MENTHAKAAKAKATDTPKRTLVVDAHVIAYLGDYMINLKKSLTHIISLDTRPSVQSNTSSDHHTT
jgi:hypothetical protein